VQRVTAAAWQSEAMLTVIGEGLVDVVQRPSGIEAHVGGSPLNVAVGLARLDHPVQFIGRYGRDAYGDSVAAHLRSKWPYPGVDALESARKWFNLGGDDGPTMVVVTRGGAGPWGITAAGEAQVATPNVEVADTVGAGDSFMAALRSGLVDRELVGGQYRHTLRSIPAEVLHALLEHAAKAAAITVSRPGPTRPRGPNSTASP
jgi:sugar/nucleoside kinase (ribokinase family)